MTELDREALVAEARRFTGAHLVYANLEQSTLDRISDGLGEARPPRQPGDGGVGHARQSARRPSGGSPPSS